MSYDKTMNFLIFDGNPNGLIMGELSNWNGRVYKIARNALTSFAHRPDCQHNMPALFYCFFQLGRVEIYSISADCPL